MRKGSRSMRKGSVKRNPTKNVKRSRSRKANGSKKRKINEYMMKVITARKNNEPSFEYKGSTYVRVPNKNLGFVYKKK